MDFEFVCWNCEEDNILWGKPAGFWTEQYRVPERWHCWNCRAVNITHDPPWTPAE